MEQSLIIVADKIYDNSVKMCCLAALRAMWSQYRYHSSGIQISPAQMLQSLEGVLHEEVDQYVLHSLTQGFSRLTQTSLPA